MNIDVATLPADGETLEGEEPASVLDLDEEGVRAESGLRYALTACVTGKELIVRGRVSASVQFRCVRCTERFPFDAEERDFLSAHELDDLTECVDLTPELREAILLAFPNYPVCREECRGLCPQCGTNLNKEKCDCRPPDDPRWAVLDGLDAE
jgi:uncharacterized protein